MRHSENEVSFRKLISESFYNWSFSRRLSRFRLRTGERSTAILATLRSPSAVPIDPTRTGTDPWTSWLLRAPPRLRCKVISAKLDILKWASLGTYLALARRRRGPFHWRNNGTEYRQKETSCRLFSLLRNFLIFCSETYSIVIKYDVVIERPYFMCNPEILISKQ